MRGGGAALIVLTIGGAASAADARTVASASAPNATQMELQPATQAVMTGLLSVCRPAAEQDLPASVFAERLGYVADPSLPPNLPIVHEGARSWRVPSSTGEVHVISGAIPEPAQQSACMVAVYGDPVVGLEDVLTKRLTARDIGFERDAKQSFTTNRFQVTHYNDSRGYLVRNVMAARALDPTPDHPTLTIVAYRVDYSWLKSASH